MRTLRWFTPLVVALALGACGQSGRKVEVAVAVDFGAAGRPAAEKKVAVTLGSTVFDALRAAYPVATSGR